MSKILVISPSGNLYGSEQVLFDYLRATSLILTVALPEKSKFFQLIKESNLNHRIKKFHPANLKFFYALLFVKLFFGKFSTVYLNEAGHIRYINLLSKIFKNKNFVVHVRLLEDTNDTRWNENNRKNLKVIAISKYIQNKLPVKSALLYDPYNFSLIRCPAFKSDSTKLRIGVVGRIAYTKGADILHQLLVYLNELRLNNEFEFFLYGEPSQDVIDNGVFNALHSFSNVHFKGFVLDKNKIYNHIDCIFHASLHEPLGRIFLEAIDYGKPLIGFDAAGIGEIGYLLNLQDLLVNPSSSGIIALLKDKLEDVRCNYNKWSKNVLGQKNKAIEIFSVSNYVNSVESFLV